MATIYDIAKIANVSPATVSRVLNGRSGVKDETVVRIRQAMEQSSFQPRWKAIDRDRILVLIPEHKGALESGYVSRILSGISDTAFASGFSLQLRPFLPQIRNDRELKQLLLSESVSGIIIITMFQGYSLAEKLSLASIPHAIVGYKMQDDGVSQILLDDYGAGKDAANYLISLHHRRIGMISFSHVDHGHQQRYCGYVDAIRSDAGGALADPFCIEAETASIEAGRNAARHLLSLPDRPSAVIITNEDLAIGFQLEARSMRVRVPQDISIVAFEESDKIGYLDLPMTAMRIPAQTMGGEAVKMLFSRLAWQKESERKRTKKPIEAAHTVKLPLSLVVRHSTSVFSKG